MIKEAIKKVVDGNNLTYDEATAVMNEMMSGTATQAQTAAFLTALRIKGETIDEITACATVMRDKALHVKRDTDVLDIVGTGGDGTGTFNISTTAAFVVAAAEFLLQSTATVQCQARAVRQIVWRLLELILQ